MYCMYCRQELPEGANFCYKCGTPFGAVSPDGVSSQGIIDLDGSKKLVQLKCDSCGALLTVDGSKKIAHCDHCGSDFMVRDDVKEINVKGNVHVGTAIINGNKSYSQGEKLSEDKLLKKAIEQLELPNPAYENAGGFFGQMCRDYPQNYKGWLGSWLVYEYCGNTSKDYARPEELFGNARKLCPNEIREELNKIHLSFALCEPYNIQFQIDNVSRDIKQLEGRVKYEREKRSETEDAIQKMRAEDNEAERKKATGLPVGIAFIAGGIILGFLLRGFIGVAVALFGIAIGMIVLIASFAGADNKGKINSFDRNVKTANSYLDKFEPKLEEQKKELEQLKERQALAPKHFEQLLAILKNK